MKFNRITTAIAKTESPRLVDPQLSVSEQIDILQVLVNDLSHDLDRLSFNIQAARAEDENTLQM